MDKDIWTFPLASRGILIFLFYLLSFINEAINPEPMKKSLDPRLLQHLHFKKQLHNQRPDKEASAVVTACCKDPDHP